MTDATAGAPFAPIAAPADSLPATLPMVLEQLWQRIAAALDGRWPPWALPQLATLGPQGPSSRVVALRSVDAAARRFVFHTDARSDKVRDLRSDPRASVTFWDPADAIEARFAGTASVHVGDDIALAAWRQVSPLRRVASAIAAPPATPLGAPQRFDAIASTPDDADAIGHFAVVRVCAVALDWLWLGPRAMRRALFRWDDVGATATWVVP